MSFVAALDADVLVSDPELFGEFLACLHAAACHVVILADSVHGKAAKSELAQYRARLNKLGVGRLWDELVVCSGPGDKARARWFAKRPADLFVSPSKSNIRAALAASASTTALYVRAQKGRI
jgi:hypothetical protein